MFPVSRTMKVKLVCTVLWVTFAAISLGAVSAFAQDDEGDLSGSHAIFPFHSRVPGLWKCTMIIDDGVNNQFLPRVLVLSANIMEDGNMINQTTHPETGIPVEDVTAASTADVVCVDSNMCP